MYLSGQGVQPTFEGYDDHADGSYTLWFGYMNRNFEEQPHIPVGPDNFFLIVDAETSLEAIREAVSAPEAWRSTAALDRGQPTHFYPRRQRFAFGVTVPPELTDQWLVWALRKNDEVLTAVGKLSPDWVWHLNPDIWRGIIDPESENQPPTIEVAGPPTVTARVGQPVELAVSVFDDGLPEAPDATGDASRVTLAPLPNNLPTIVYRSTAFAPVLSPAAASDTGLGVTWLHYRGPGEVSFEPSVISLDNAGGMATTSARFDEPGTYELRAFADDGFYTGLSFSSVSVVVEDERD